MTFIDAAIFLLRRRRQPAQSRVITRLAVAQKLLSHVGSSPETAMAQALKQAAARPEAARLVEEPRPDFFTLTNAGREYAQKLVVEPPPPSPVLPALPKARIKPARPAARERTPRPEDQSRRERFAPNRARGAAPFHEKKAEAPPPRRKPREQEPASPGQVQPAAPPASGPTGDGLARAGLRIEEWLRSAKPGTLAPFRELLRLCRAEEGLGEPGRWQLLAQLVQATFFEPQPNKPAIFAGGQIGLTEELEPPPPDAEAPRRPTVESLRLEKKLALRLAKLPAPLVWPICALGLRGLGMTKISRLESRGNSRLVLGEGEIGSPPFVVPVAVAAFADTQVSREKAINICRETMHRRHAPLGLAVAPLSALEGAGGDWPPEVRFLTPALIARGLIQEKVGCLQAGNRVAAMDLSFWRLLTGSDE